MRKQSLNKAEREQREKLAIEYLEIWKHYPKRFIARKLSEDHPEIFKGIEDARSKIRVITLSSGERLAKLRINAGKKIINHNQELIDLPEPHLTELENYVIPKANNRIGIISDLHLPKHTKKHIDIALNDFKEKEVNCIIINGDLIDNPQFSKFSYDPRYSAKTEEWFNMAEYFLESLREKFPNALILFIEGNHDAWYKRYLWNKAKNIGGDSYYSLESRLHLAENNIIWIPEIQLVQLADYYVFHGHQHIKGGQLDTSAKRLLNKVKSNCIIGHLHYASMFQDVGFNDEPLATVHVSGALCTRKPSYMPFGGKARDGYITAEVINDKLKVENIWIKDGKKTIINV